MPTNIRTITIFLSSPSDVSDAREAVKRAVEQLNIWWPKAFGANIYLITSEDSIYSSFESTAQEVINSQTGTYDVYIGLMWSRYGTITKKGVSGTVEEFLIALENHRSHQAPSLVSFYFCQAAVPLNLIDIDQISKVNEFKNTVQKEGYYKKYNNADDLQSRIQIDLNLWTSTRIISNNDINKLDRRASIAPVFYVTVECDEPMVVFRAVWDNFSIANEALLGMNNCFESIVKILSFAKDGEICSSPYELISRCATASSRLGIIFSNMTLESIIMLDCFVYAVRVIFNVLDNRNMKDVRLSEWLKPLAHAVVDISNHMKVLLPLVRAMETRIQGLIPTRLPSFNVAGDFAIRRLVDIERRINIMRNVCSDLDGLLSIVDGQSAMKKPA